MINKAKLAVIAAVAAVSVVSPALAQSQIVSPPNTAVPPSLFVPQTGQTVPNLPTVQALVVPRLSRTVRRVAPMRPASLAKLRPTAQLALASISIGSPGLAMPSSLLARPFVHTLAQCPLWVFSRMDAVASEGVSPCYVKP